MEKISIQKLTPENFRVYGSFSNMINPEAARLGPEPIEFYRDMEQLSLGQATTVSFSVCRVTKRPFVINKLEFHNLTNEGLMPIDGDVLIHLALATRNGDVPMDRIEAFLVQKGTLVTIRPGVWHHAPFPFGSDYVNVLVALPERTYVNDCSVFMLPDDKQIEIVQ